MPASKEAHTLSALSGVEGSVDTAPQTILIPERHPPTSPLAGDTAHLTPDIGHRTRTALGPTGVERYDLGQSRRVSNGGIAAGTHDLATAGGAQELHGEAER